MSCALPGRVCLLWLDGACFSSLGTKADGGKISGYFETIGFGIAVNQPRGFGAHIHAAALKQNSRLSDGTRRGTTAAGVKRNLTVERQFRNPLTGFEKMVYRIEKQIHKNFSLIDEKGKQMGSKILVVGSINTDISVRLPALPRMGETVIGRSLRFTPGGKGANQACAAAKLEGSVSFLGCVGDDTFGQAQIGHLKKAGVDVSHLKIAAGKTTGTAIICVDDRGQNDIVVVAGANEDCGVSYLQENDSLFQAASMVLLQMEIPPESTFYAIRRAGQLHKAVILNPAPAPDSLPDDIWKQLDYITPNETELQKLSGCPVKTDADMRAAAERLLEHGVKNVLVTIGKRGAMLVNRDSARIFPAPKVKPVDTTAAGDTMNAAFLVALSEGKPVEDAVRFGNAASSITVTRNGAQESVPVRGEADAAYLAFSAKPVDVGCPSGQAENKQRR